VGAPQGTSPDSRPRAEGEPRLMQVSLRRRLTDTSFELIGGPIFLLG